MAITANVTKMCIRDRVCLAQQYIAEGGIGYAKELLEKALGSEKAQGVISKLTACLLYTSRCV